MSTESTPPGGVPGHDAAIETAARAVIARRDAARPVPVPPDHERPADLASGYQIQAAVHRILATERQVRCVGWKIAGTNGTARAYVGVDAPFYGRLHDSTTTASPAEVPVGPGCFRVHEAEIGIELAVDLDPAAAPFTAADVEAATRALLPSIEIAGSCYEPWVDAGAPSLIADNAAHGWWVFGPEQTDWSNLDLLDLPVTVIVNGETAATGSPRNVDGGPFGATAWLANTLAETGTGLQAGDRITTGITTVPVPAAPGQHVIADFGPLGRVELRLALAR